LRYRKHELNKIQFIHQLLAILFH